MGGRKRGRWPFCWPPRCSAYLVGLAAGDPPAERAEALFRAGREEFDRAAAELLAGMGRRSCPGA